jgi:MFS family permease
MRDDFTQTETEGAAAKSAGATEPSPRGLFWSIFPSVMLPMFLAVADQTIVATALPAITADLGGVERISWVVVSYLIANTIAAPVYGRLGDSVGRRPMILTALALFMVGSVLCALSPSIEFLTAARVLQGFGGGGLVTLSQALVGETIPPRQRGRYQGYLAVTQPSAGDRFFWSTFRSALRPWCWYCALRPNRATGAERVSTRRGSSCSRCSSAL